MSGGYHNYECYRVEEEYVGKMHDPEMDQMMKQLVNVLHDLEWWASGDIVEEEYRQSVRDFKFRWFTPLREQGLCRIIEEKCDALKKELFQTIGYEIAEKPREKASEKVQAPKGT